VYFPATGVPRHPFLLPPGRLRALPGFATCFGSLPPRAACGRCGRSMIPPAASGYHIYSYGVLCNTCPRLARGLLWQRWVSNGRQAGQTGGGRKAPPLTSAPGIIRRKNQVPDLSIGNKFGLLSRITFGYGHLFFENSVLRSRKPKRERVGPGRRTSTAPAKLRATPVQSVVLRTRKMNDMKMKCKTGKGTLISANYH
jgi:hypothetical protein